MKIEDPDHAERVLKHLAEESKYWPRTYFEWGNKTLIDGVEAVLGKIREQERRIQYAKDYDFYPKDRQRRYTEHAIILEVALCLAQAYAPKMIEAGMTVPE